MEKKVNKKVIMIAAVAGVVILIIIGVIIGFMVSKSKKTSVPEVLETTVTAVSKLVTTEYEYKDFQPIEEEGLTIGTLTVPGTSSFQLFIYSGKISAGIDFSSTSYDIDNDNKVITISIPEPEIFSHEITSIQFYDVKKKLFESKSTQEYYDKIFELKEQKEQMLKEDENFLETITENAKTALTNFLTTADSTKDYQISFVDVRKDTASEE